MKKNLTITIFTALFVFAICILQAQNKTTWKVYFPGVNYYNSFASDDASQDLNLAMNYFSPGQGNKFISLNPKGFKVFEQSTTEIALMNYRDSSGNRYLISYAQPVLHVQKYDSQNTLIWDNPLALTHAVDTNYTFTDELIHSTQCAVTANGKLVVAGTFKTDTIGFNDASLTVFFFDINSGNLLNTYYDANFYFPPYKIEMQEDSAGNINILSYDGFQEVYLKKISQSGILLADIQIGDTPNSTSQIVSFKMTPNFIYVPVIDTNVDLYVLKLNKNSFDTVYYNLCLAPYNNFGDVFDGTDSIFYVSYDDGAFGGFKAYDFYGNVVCNPPSNYANSGYRGFAVHDKIYIVYNGLTTIDGNSCGYGTACNGFDYDTWNLIILPTEIPSYTYSDIIKDNVFYLMSKTLNYTLGVVGVVDEKANDFGGRMYFDANNNCIADSNETGLVNQLIKIDPPGNYVFTDKTGHFENFLDSGAYTLSGVPFNTTLNFCPLSVAFAVNDTTVFYGNNNIGAQDQSGNLQDLAISINQTIAIPGYISDVYVTVLNNEPLPASGWVKLTVDSSLFALAYANPLADSISGNDYYWHLDTLTLLTQKHIDAEFIVNVNAALGTGFTSTAQVVNAAGENYLLNNTDNYQGIIVGSYDPNHKDVYPKGAGSNGYISPNDTVLNYKIQFQNTGIYNAYTITVIDTIDANLDLSTFRLISSSHSCVASFLANNVIQLKFENIMLPDSNSNELLSHGFINYSINMLHGLALQTQIRNKAAIYFDFNSPVMTNETLNTIDALGINIVNKRDDIDLFPNPTASSSISISHLNPAAFYTISVKDVLGNTLIAQKHKGSEQAVVNVAQLAAGLYVVVVEADGKAVVRKLVKE